MCCAVGSHLFACMSIKHTKQCCVLVVKRQLHCVCILHVGAPALTGGQAPPEPVIASCPGMLRWGWVQQQAAASSSRSRSSNDACSNSSRTSQESVRVHSGAEIYTAQCMHVSQTSMCHRCTCCQVPSIGCRTSFVRTCGIGAHKGLYCAFGTHQACTHCGTS